MNNGELTNVQKVQLHDITVNLQNHKTNKKNNTVLDEKGLGETLGVCNSQKRRKTPFFFLKSPPGQWGPHLGVLRVNQEQLEQTSEAGQAVKATHEQRQIRRTSETQLASMCWLLGSK